MSALCRFLYFLAVRSGGRCPMIGAVSGRDRCHIEVRLVVYRVSIDGILHHDRCQTLGGGLAIPGNTEEKRRCEDLRSEESVLPVCWKERPAGMFFCQFALQKKLCRQRFCTCRLEYLSEHDVDECLDENLGVEPPAAVLEVVEVEFEAAEHLLHGVGVAVVERGIGSHAGTYLVEIDVARVVLDDLVDVELALGARTDEGHVALHHIPQLGQLVEMVQAKEKAHTGHARFVLMLVEGWPVFFGIDTHAAELVNLERAAKPPDALLTEDGRPAVLALHGDVADKEKGREHYQGDRGYEEIADTLDVAFHFVHAVGDEAGIIYVVVPFDVWRYASFLLLHVFLFLEQIVHKPNS